MGNLRGATGIVLLSLAIGVCLLLGTLGWFAVGFGIMTDCTNNYSCSTTGCPPCATTGRWINAGAFSQWVLAATGVVLLVHGLRSRHRVPLALCAAGLLGISALTLVGTTWRAQESYCQPGSPGYARSYCAVAA